ncbi:hypothetical protein RhiirA5_435116 [Rhizophagus irregularis]|uniref:Uncharacterized protein n=2 Tax=Rhizophagus irregularis TaxID=588596 RepID=A0A2N0NNW4_9GLOM|nr:hypothetical protein GLOIN_2v1764388 [Rhizophagus irregularis DAOM 181602=DAOM 197198]PKB96268.1 hypothetical protein RhiirA5_435116 [Rhizophagus irregularis]POG80536.1 hypothetical protein GLOIN_2v1764388 [Rhizophagus irregularis DAOM 181602=DAOM 197198]UZO10165.1 hypothetical protein OCT59_001763 [Rhizophagus irregularis]CAB5202296.1 unnamed protein product [Rhizophagus irregularis]GET50518.1 kinase-like domain-containing protein [Rhizophagus irregularis DAOM 181602=DAOM 197198]|eukprot:XP_025187402.1 hypothetical protein GLOIN_2v1764388 [Rhizophagus irregularis DAOM 181602=DAOM 197198]
MVIIYLRLLTKIILSKFDDNQIENSFNKNKIIKKIKLIENENNDYIMKEFELDIDTNSEKRAQKSKENVQSRSEEVNLESDRKEKTEGGRKTSNNGSYSQ